LTGVLLGGIDFTGLVFPIGKSTVTYGNFIQAIINFLVISFSIFLFVRIVSRFQRMQEAAPAAPPPPTKEETLLAEIRDLLKVHSSK
jgi:large conductance mechanosensitive channel